ncbi:MAG: anti-sigma factor family protein [Candidatus Methylomirabilales bacterium]
MSSVPEMSCKELVELITEYLERILSPADRLRFETHLADCHGCHTYLEQMQQIIRTLGHLPEEPIPPSAQQELLQAFRTWRRTGGRRA